MVKHNNSLTLIVVVLVVGLMLDCGRASVLSASNAAELQAVLGTALSGDTIQLSSTAVFAPQTTLRGVNLDGVRIESSSGAQPAVVDCSAVADGVCLALSSCTGVTLRNVQLHSFRNGGLSVSSSSQMTVADVRLHDGSGVDLPALGVSASDRVVIDRVTVENNVNARTAAGVQLINCVNCTLSSSTLANNRAVVFAALAVWQSSLSVVRSEITDNAGIANCMLSRSDVRVTASQFAGNSGAASAVCEIDDSTAVFQQCEVRGNSGAGDAGVAALFDASNSNVTFQCCNISGNAAAQSSAEASVINFVGLPQAPSWPPGVVCIDGQLFNADQQPLGVDCPPNPRATLTLNGVVLFDAPTSSGAPAVRLRHAALVANYVQLSSPDVLLSLGDDVSASVAVGSAASASQISGKLRCVGAAVTTQWGAGVCGATPCACGVTAAGAPLVGKLPSGACNSGTSVNGTVVVPVDDNGGVVIVEGPTGTGVVVVPNPLPNNTDVISPVVEVTVNGTGGNVGPVVITLPYNCSADGFCLAFFDVNRSRWTCVDSCLSLSRDGRQCYATGVTPHLTNFALLLIGNVDACGNASRTYQWATIIALAVAATLVLAVVVLFGYVPALSRWCLGEEGARVKQLRKHVKNLENSDAFVDGNVTPDDQPVREDV